MSKELKHNAAVPKNRLSFEPRRLLRKEWLQKYKKTVDQALVFRIPIVIFFALLAFLFFIYVDRAVYPAQAPLFFKIRFINSILVTLVCAGVFFKPLQRYSIWILDFIVLCFVFCFSLMIYFADGTSSNYYAGINLALLGMTIVNGFYFWHCLTVSLLTIAMYSVAAFANDPAPDIVNYFAAMCFVCTTAFFAVLLTRFYSNQHFEAFIRNEELKESERKLEVLYGMADERSKIDDLTKIYNRGYFFEILAAKINACRTTDSFFYLIIFDIDHLKEINDACGHLFGDQVITAVAKAVQGVMRPNSYLGRYGGDEFMLILDKATPKEFFARLDRVRQAIQGLEMFCDGKPVNITASFGAARWESSMTGEKQLIGLADQALLEVKRGKRGEIKLAN